MNVERLSSRKLAGVAEHTLAQVDDACREGRGWNLWLDHIDATAAVMAGTAFLTHLADAAAGSVTDFWRLPSDIQAPVILIGCDFAIATRKAFAASIPCDPATLADIENRAARAFQSHIDRLLAGAVRGGTA